MIILITGVSGSGKTSIGHLLSTSSGIPFYDADDFHSLENKHKMSTGIPLTDEDREPWLRDLASLIKRYRNISEESRELNSMILACSALKRSYRAKLLDGDANYGCEGWIKPKDIHIVYLHAPPSVLHARLIARTDHYMKSGMLDSQLASLEPPGVLEEGAIWVNVDDEKGAGGAVKDIREYIGV